MSLARRLHHEWVIRRNHMHVKPQRFGSFGKAFLVPPVVATSPGRIHIGDGVIIQSGAWFSVVEEDEFGRYEPELRIGDNVRIGRMLYIGCMSRIEIGAGTWTGDRILIADCFHTYDDPRVPIGEQGMTVSDGISIGEGCMLYPGATILGGVRLGRNCSVAANAVVTRSAPAGSVLAGNPARIIRHYDWDANEWRDGAPEGEPSGPQPLRDGAGGVWPAAGPAA